MKWILVIVSLRDWKNGLPPAGKTCVLFGHCSSVSSKGPGSQPVVVQKRLLAGAGAPAPEGLEARPKKPGEAGPRAEPGDAKPVLGGETEG